MLLLAVYVLVLLTLWWACLRPPGERRATGTAVPVAPPRPPGDLLPDAPVRRGARRRELLDPPLTEDDVIAFGLALESTVDVVQSAVADASRGPTEPRVRRDVAGPS